MENNQSYSFVLDNEETQDVKKNPDSINEDKKEDTQKRINFAR